jgi:hypothetical protein
VFSWLGLIILLTFFIQSENFARRKFVLPLLFIIWANIHGSFLSGLMALSVFFLDGLEKEIVPSELGVLSEHAYNINKSLRNRNLWKFGHPYLTVTCVFDSRVMLALTMFDLQWLPPAVSKFYLKYRKSLA